MGSRSPNCRKGFTVLERQGNIFRGVPIRNYRGRPQITFGMQVTRRKKACSERERLGDPL